MQYLDTEKLNAIDSEAFLEVKPYPFINPAGVLTEAGYQRLIENLPPLEVMQPSFGRKRSHGQVSHDRYLLEYSEDLDTVAPAWHEFVAELHGPEYTRFLQRMYQRKRLRINMHWHYAPRGCSVSPHCDAQHKLGSHIFYLNTEDDWDPEWGGQTLILDDNGRFETNSAPAFEDFDRELASECVGNVSTLFARRDRSWHGVRELTCPEGRLRKVFIVVVNHPLLYAGRQVLNRIKNK
ncbi:MAG: hypothetical protein PVF89_03660 [Lysobacterales bacterium]|jgi:hypothetical protein